MVVNPKPLTPLVGAVTIDCNISSGSVQLSGLPSGNGLLIQEVFQVLLILK
jgi:hypothetical protein